MQPVGRFLRIMGYYFATKIQKMSKNNNLLLLFNEAILNAKINPFSKDKAARILAYLFHYGGSNEKIVYSQKAQADIFTAQKMGNMYGGEIPDKEVSQLYKHYCAEIQESYQSGGQFLDWVLDISSSWGITHKQGTNYQTK
jgi:hypothetical protein